MHCIGWVPWKGRFFVIIIGYLYTTTSDFVNKLPTQLCIMFVFENLSDLLYAMDKL